jgi:hypothetical protein
MKDLRTNLSFSLIFYLCVSCSSIENKQDSSELVHLGNGICRQKNGLMWQKERSSKFSSFQEAEDYMSKIELGGYTDWRFPTKDELFGLCYIVEHKLTADCPLNSGGSYWSKNGKGEAGEWYPYPLCAGYDFRFLKSNIGRVRAVRP